MLRQGHEGLGSFARLFGEAKNRSEAEPAMARPGAQIKKYFCRLMLYLLAGNKFFNFGV